MYLEKKTFQLRFLQPVFENFPKSKIKGKNLVSQPFSQSEMSSDFCEKYLTL